MKAREAPASEMAHALAILGLRPGASEKEIKRRYRKLVKQWHPDQFANDPQGSAEATQRLRLINRAYETLCSQQTDVSSTVQTQEDRDSTGDGQSRAPYTFNREQIDEIIAALRHKDSFIDQLRADPWNRVIFLGLAFAEFVVSMWVAPLVQSESALPGVRAFPLPVASLGLSVAVAPLVWSLDPGLKILGWSIYFMFTIGLPLVAYMIMSTM